MKDHLKTIPKRLWQDADSLINYVKYKPFTPPECCPHCQSNHMVSSFMTQQGQQYYECLTCRRHFNNLTGTYFAKSNRHYLSLWPDFVQLRFAGNSLKAIAKQMQISRKAASNRDRIILQIMQDHFPDLHEWWRTHIIYEDDQQTEQVQKQAKAFKAWLKKLINQQTTTNPLEATALLDLPYKEKWTEFAELLIQGKSNVAIGKQLNISRVVAHWRKQFTTQMEQLNYHELVFWIDWQLNCNRTTQAVKGKTRDKTHIIQ